MTVEQTEALKSLFDLGSTVVVTAMLWVVWRRLNDVTDRLIDILAELRAQTVAISSESENRKRNP